MKAQNGPSRQPDEPYHYLTGFRGVSSSEVYAVGDNGKIFAYSGDVDGDGITDLTDNCLLIPNGPNLGACTSRRYYRSNV